MLQQRTAAILGLRLYNHAPMPVKRLNAPLSDMTKRLILVYKDYLKDHPEGNQANFGAMIGITQSTLSRVFKGENYAGRKIVDGVCLRLGYSADWFVNGKGPKKADTKTTTLHELQMLRAEVAVLRSQVEEMKKDMKILAGARVVAQD